MIAAEKKAMLDEFDSLFDGDVDPRDVLKTFLGRDSTLPNFTVDFSNEGIVGLLK